MNEKYSHHIFFKTNEKDRSLIICSSAPFNKILAQTITLTKINKNDRLEATILTAKYINPKVGPSLTNLVQEDRYISRPELQGAIRKFIDPQYYGEVTLNTTTTFPLGKDISFSQAYEFLFNNYLNKQKYQANKP